MDFNKRILMKVLGGCGLGQRGGSESHHWVCGQKGDGKVGRIARMSVFVSNF